MELVVAIPATLVKAASLVVVAPSLGTAAARLTIACGDVSPASDNAPKTRQLMAPWMDPVVVLMGRLVLAHHLEIVALNSATVVAQLLTVVRDVKAILEPVAPKSKIQTFRIHPKMVYVVERMVRLARTLCLETAVRNTDTVVALALTAVLVVKRNTANVV
jgi:hypothetical protein